MPRGDRHWAAAQVGRPLEQRRTSGGKARNSTFATPGDGAGSDTRNLRGLMPNSPPNSLNLKHLGGRPLEQRRTSGGKARNPLSQ